MAPVKDETIYDMIGRWNFSCEENFPWTAWKASLQDAKVVHLLRNENWLEDDENSPKIQIMRMNASNLNLNDEHDNNIPVSDHPYEDMLDVIKLPMAIPGLDPIDAPKFLFIRPDDYDLFFCVMKNRTLKFVLMGNPGISKSWFHWKYLLFCYHPELYNAFKPKHDEHEQSEDGQKESATHSPKKQRLQDYEEIPPTTVFDDIPTIPEIVVRTKAGTESQIFEINTKDPVKVVKHSPQDLKDFTTSKITILWEPSETKTPVPYEEIMAQLIATLSPDKIRFQELVKHRGQFLFMPCPSEVQLRLMGKVLRDAKLCNFTDQTIRERIRDYGPFIRLVLTYNDAMLGDYKRQRDKELSNIGGDNLGRLLTNIVDVSDDGVSDISHRIVRYMANRNNSEIDFYGYQQNFFVSSCDAVINEIKKKIVGFDKHTIIDHLVKVNDGTKSLEEFIPKYLEKVAVLHLTSPKGLQWKFRSLIEAESEWMPISLQLGKLEPFAKYSDMEEGSLYHPSDPLFPLVDMYWKQNGMLNAIQATRSGKHPKPVSTYKKFFAELDVNMNSISFNLYYLFMPF